jgi:hypothetical protein
MVMTVTQQVVQYGQRRITRRVLRAAPWVGSLLALATLGAAIRRKGALRGTIDTVLDVIPFVGGAKNAVEIARGRDLLRDRPKPYDEVARRTR